MAIKKITSTINQLGLIEGLIYFLSRAVSLLTFGRCRIIRYHFVAQPVPPQTGLGIRPSPNSFVGFIKASDSLVASFPRPTSVIENRFKNGNICLVAKSGEKFAGFIWLAKGQYEEDEVRCCYQLLHPGQSVWDFDVYVEPEFRYGRTLARLWDSANSFLAEDGVLWSFSRISASNSESLRAHSRLDIQRLFTATFFCLGKFQMTIVGVNPFIHISLSNDCRPTLGLKPATTPNNSAQS